MRQANLQIAVAEPRLEDPRWEPLFDLLEQTGHRAVASTSPCSPKAGDRVRQVQGQPGATFLHAKMFIEQFLDPFVDLFAWGILERHPKLKIVIAESGVGWVPWVVEELDYRYWRLMECKEFWDDKGGIPHKMKPSEVFQRQVYGTFQQSPTAMRAARVLGPGQPAVGERLSAPGFDLAQLGAHDRRDDGPHGPGRRAQARRRQRGQALRARLVEGDRAAPACRSAARKAAA